MKIEWGKKVTCPACAMRLYDLMQNPAICPYCGNSFDTLDIKFKKKDIVVTDDDFGMEDLSKDGFKDLDFTIDEDVIDEEDDIGIDTSDNVDEK